MPLRPSRLIPLALIGSLALAECDVVFGLGGAGAIRAQSQGSMNLRLRRGTSGVELVIEGVGDQPFLQQRMNGQIWEGSLRTQGAPGVRNGQVRLTDPVAGIQSATLAGSGSSYALKVTPSPGRPLQDPVVSTNGRDLILKFPGFVVAPTLQTGQLDLNTPGRVPQAQYAPPLRPRAVAPPLGDMAVGTMVLQNRSYVNLSGPQVTLSLKNAPAKDALMSLARMGDYGFVFVGNTVDEKRVANENNDVMSADYPITLDFRREEFGRAFNSVLLASGLQGKLDGRTILVGENVSSKGFGPIFSKTIRLNSVSALSAAMYLGSLGAQIQQVTTVQKSKEQEAGKSGRGTASTREGQLRQSGELGLIESVKGRKLTTFRSNLTQIDTYGASEGPLKGLAGTTDSRLQSITLMGDSKVIEVANNYLKLIDLRQRQVALSVKILDVTLDNDSSIQNDFAFRYGNNFIVSDDGKMVGAFGGLLPPNSNNFDEIAGGAQSGKAQTVTVEGRDVTVKSVVVPPSQSPGRINPGMTYPKDRIFNYLRSVITSGSAKTLASPTMILSENPEAIQGGSREAGISGSGLTSSSIGRPFSNESFVAVGTNEIINYEVQAGQNGAANTCQPEFGISGLTLGARIAKIDDNGFVTFSLSPEISATTSSLDVKGCGPISVLSLRRLDTGTVRVRDGQTLILTGVISDADIQNVQKWPLLGDLPLIGQFFRRTAGSRQKRELVILVTPRIIDDSQGNSYGYGFRPSTSESRELLGAS